LYPVKGGLFRWKLADSLQRAHSVLVVSRSAGEDLCSLFKVPDERVKVVSNTLSGSFLREVSAEQIAQVKERCGIRGPYMISVGTLQPRKNFAGLIEAFSLLEGALPDDFHLVIMGGEGWMYDDVLAARERSPLKERIVLTGWIPGEDRPALYRGALALVLPSFYEGFGIPIIEAFASHIPVACSNVSSLPEVAGDAALLFDPRRCEDIADAVSALIEDGTLREELVRRGSKRLAAFHPDAVGKELHRILEEQK
jgi:glycosyltransferase involved in cell wall biosynthesis